jgi:hypothetical protein
MQLSMLGSPIIDFISSVIRGGKAKAWLKTENLESLIVAIFGWIQMTEEDVRTYRSVFVRLTERCNLGGNMGERCECLCSSGRRRDADIQLTSSRIGSPFCECMRCTMYIHHVHQFMQTLIDREPVAAARALSQSVNRTVADSEQAKSSGNPDWYVPRIWVMGSAHH